MISMLLSNFITLLKEPLKFIYELGTHQDFRRLVGLHFRVGMVSRHRECAVKVAGLNLVFPDSASFLSAYREIFVNKVYDFSCPNDSPVILDLGANIGLSVLYFKQKYPNSRIFAFEPDPVIFSYLRRNIENNHLANVELLNYAAWGETTTLQFLSDGADAGRIVETGSLNSVTIHALDIREFMKSRKLNHLDMLKIDVEGAEDVVLPACERFLPSVENIFVEYHSLRDRPQFLDRLTKILSDAGFRLHIHSVFTSPRPLVERRANSMFDMQLNIFGWRE